MLNASHFEFVFDLFMSVQRVGTSWRRYQTANHFEPDGIHGETAVISFNRAGQGFQNASMHLPDLPSYRIKHRHSHTHTHRVNTHLHSEIYAVLKFFIYFN